MIRIGFDIGGVLSAYPDILLPLLRALAASGDVEVHAVTDMPREKALAMLALNAVPVPPERVHSADYAAHGDACKAVLARELGLDVLLDDHLGYAAVPGAPLRLLAMPNGDRDYYHRDWKTDGSEGAFGRRLQGKA